MLGDARVGERGCEAATRVSEMERVRGGERESGK